MEKLFAKIDGLTEDQQMQLGYFKALELTNASIKMHLITVPDKLGREVGQLVCELLEKRRIDVGVDIFSIEDPVVFDIIDQGMTLFRQWLVRRESHSPCQKLSCYICKALSPTIFDGLVLLSMALEDYDEAFVSMIANYFLWQD